MGYQIKRREDDLGMGAGRRRVHFELWLDDRRSPTATAVIEDGGATVNWSAHAQAMPDEYRGPCAHAAYRCYYLVCKMADRRGRPQRWRCPPPTWMADRVERADSLWVASGRLQEARGGAGEYRGSGRARAGRLEPPARVLVVP